MLEHAYGPVPAAYLGFTGDFWYVRDGKISEFNCYVGVSVMLAQLGINPDFASAVAAKPAAA